MLTQILVGAAVILVLLLVVVAFLPAGFRVERNTTIAAPAPAVFPLVNDFHRWDAWSPWAKIDPGMKTAHSGSALGDGAIYWWQGNNKVGEGRMTITDSQPNERVRIKLEFIRPFKATNTAEFTFKPAGSQTVVNWAMVGTRNFMFKLVGVFVSMDKMIGPDFEKGLAQLKAAAEGRA